MIYTVFSLGTAFPLLYTTTVVYKGEHKSTIQTISYQYERHSITQLANYHLPKSVADLSKNAKRRQSAALLLMQNAHSFSKSLKKFD